MSIIEASDIDQSRIEFEREQLELEKGTQYYDKQKGKVVDRIGGNRTDSQALSLGYLHSKSIVIINALTYVQRVLNKLCSMEPDLVPVMEKTPHGQVWVRDLERAKLLGAQYGLEIVQKGVWAGKNFIPFSGEADKYYYDYKGNYIKSNNIEKFAIDVVRTSSSFKGTTTEQLLVALGTIKTMPPFQMVGGMRPQPEVYGQNYKDEDAD